MKIARRFARPLCSWPLVFLLLPALGQAALEIGEPAPVFVTQAAINGKLIDYSLADELRKGPVVLYFYQSSFSVGCSMEAHEFTDAPAAVNWSMASEKDRKSVV